MKNAGGGKKSSDRKEFSKGILKFDKKKGVHLGGIGILPAKDVKGEEEKECLKRKVRMS